MAGEWEWLTSLFGGGGGGVAPMDPNGVGGAPGQQANPNSIARSLAAMQGVVAPPPVTPIMPTGSIRPPDAGNSLSATAASGQNLQKIVAQLLQHNVPGGLGSYINPRG